MAHVRSKAAVAMVAVLLTSCTGGDRPDTARQSEVPPQALESEALLAKSPAAVADSGLAVPPPPSAEQNVVVTGTRALRQDFNSPSPVATVTSSPPALAARSPGFEQRIAPPLYVDEGRDRFTSVEQNRFRVVGEEPVSTFSIDVDTASYGWMRASLNRNVLPQPDSVRTEELINYFPYDYARPASAEQPFSTRVDVFPSPWTEGRKLVRVGIRGYEVERASRPSANLVFLIDTSGSMSAPNKLGLVRQSLAMLVEQLGANDTV
jgi:Ca-activated chloride channel family protein